MLDESGFGPDSPEVGPAWAQGYEDGRTGAAGRRSALPVGWVQSAYTAGYGEGAGDRRSAYIEAYIYGVEERD